MIENLNIEEMNEKLQIIDEYLSLVDKDTIALTQEQINAIKNLTDSGIEQEFNTYVFKAKKLLDEIKSDYEKIEKMSKNISVSGISGQLTILEGRIKAQTMALDDITKRANNIDFNQISFLLKKYEKINIKDIEEKTENSIEVIKTTQKKNLLSTLVLCGACVVILGVVFYAKSTFENVYIIKEEITKSIQDVQMIKQDIAQVEKDKNNLKQGQRYIRYLNSNCYYTDNIDVDKLLENKFEAKVADTFFYFQKDDKRVLAGYCK